MGVNSSIDSLQEEDILLDLWAKEWRLAGVEIRLINKSRGYTIEGFYVLSGRPWGSTYIGVEQQAYNHWRLANYSSHLPAEHTYDDYFSLEEALSAVDDILRRDSF